MNPPIVIVAEHEAGKVRPVTYELLAFAKKLCRIKSATVKVLVLGNDVHAIADDIARSCGKDVISVQVPGLMGYNAEAYRLVLDTEIRELRPAYVCISHSTQGIDFAPAVAAKLGAGCISGVEDLFETDDKICFIRSIYGGKILAHAVCRADTTVLTIQPGIFKLAEAEMVSPGVVEKKTAAFSFRQSRSMGIKKSEADTSRITEAKVVVAAGNGIRTEENLDLIHQMAALFPRSAVAGSRIVCDLGWLAYNQQVGVTGATVTPELYIACGISGATQHVQGMRGSGFIVSINTDPSAAIFKVSDVCVVEDLTAFIPILIETFEKFKNKSI
jgi:electron transfer flavoprotein alpha subunit